MQVATASAQCGGCGEPVGPVHRCPQCLRHMHTFCRRPTGDEIFGQSVVGPDCDNTDQSSNSTPCNEAVLAATKNNVEVLGREANDSEGVPEYSQSQLPPSRPQSRNTHVNQPIYDRLFEIYRQLQGFTTPPGRMVIEDFIVILRRFITARYCDTYPSRVATLCASRTIAGRNYSIHHDIDRFLLSTAGHVNTAPVHTWQPGWHLASQKRHNAMQACLQNPVPFLNELETDDEKRDAVASLQFEARMCGNATASTRHTNTSSLPALQCIDEFGTIPDWFIPAHEVEFGPFLSEGSFAAVYKSTWNGANVVVKQVLTQLKSAEDRALFRQEVDLWFSLNHDHLIKLYGACHVGRAAFVCEIATRGTLVSFAKNKGRWEIWKCIYEASLGLLHLHERQIVHGDLKGNNILVCEENVKLADFGLSCVANRPETSIGASGALGAFQWKAPQCLKGGAPIFASDIYSFGMCILEVLTSPHEGN